VLEDLQKRSLITEGSRLSLTGQALTIAPRVMADLFVRHLHPEVLIYEEDGPPLPQYSPFHFWRVPNDRGIIFHTFLVVPVLMDFRVVSENHTECFDRNTYEYVYISENFSHGKTHIIQDSDEFGIISLTPSATNWAPPQVAADRFRWLSNYKQLSNIRESMWFFAGRNQDVLRRDLFRLPIRWHTTDLDEVWMKHERRIDRLINYAVGDYYNVSRPPNTRRFPSRLNLSARVLLSDASIVNADSRERMALFIDSWSRFVDKVIFAIRVTGKRVGLALYGDQIALRWWGWRLRKLGATMLGRSFQEPKPPTPE
jgi:hypothetical protein